MAIIFIGFINFSNKYLLPNSIIVYGDNNTTNILTTLMTSFKDIFINIKKTINILKE